MEKMLIVDDNGDLRKILRITFGYGKYKVFEADNGEQALEIAARELPEIILLDIMMPGIDGVEVCRRIKSNPDLHSSFVIMLTALGQQKDRESALGAGADFYMTKPFSPNELIMVIEGIRTGKKTAEELGAGNSAFDLRWSDKQGKDKPV